MAGAKEGAIPVIAMEVLLAQLVASKPMPLAESIEIDSFLVRIFTRRKEGRCSQMGFSTIQDPRR